MSSTPDFRANQVQTKKIVASGSTGTNAKLLVYSEESEDKTNPNTGEINPNAFDFDGIGEDIFMYVSGTVSSGSAVDRISVYGGSVFISGNLSIAGHISASSGAGAGGVSGPTVSEYGRVALFGNATGDMLITSSLVEASGAVVDILGQLSPVSASIITVNNLNTPSEEGRLVLSGNNITIIGDDVAGIVAGRTDPSLSLAMTYVSGTEARTLAYGTTANAVVRLSSYSPFSSSHVSLSTIGGDVTEVAIDSRAIIVSGASGPSTINIRSVSEGNSSDIWAEAVSLTNPSTIYLKADEIGLFTNIGGGGPSGSAGLFIHSSSIDKAYLGADLGNGDFETTEVLATSNDGTMVLSGVNVGLKGKAVSLVSNYNPSLPGYDPNIGYGIVSVSGSRIFTVTQGADAYNSNIGFAEVNNAQVVLGAIAVVSAAQEATIFNLAQGRNLAAHIVLVTSSVNASSVCHVLTQNSGSFETIISATTGSNLNYIGALYAKHDIRADNGIFDGTGQQVGRADINLTSVGDNQSFIKLETVSSGSSAIRISANASGSSDIFIKVGEYSGSNATLNTTAISNQPGGVAQTNLYTYLQSDGTGSTSLLTLGSGQASAIFGNQISGGGNVSAMVQNTTTAGDAQMTIFNTTDVGTATMGLGNASTNSGSVSTILITSSSVVSDADMLVRVDGGLSASSRFYTHGDGPASTEFVTDSPTNSLVSFLATTTADSGVANATLSATSTGLTASSATTTIISETTGLSGSSLVSIISDADGPDGIAEVLIDAEGGPGGYGGIKLYADRLGFNVQPFDGFGPVGTDTYLYVSGGIGQKNIDGGKVAVTGGDLVVSGNLHLLGTAYGSFGGGGVTGPVSSSVGKFALFGDTTGDSLITSSYSQINQTVLDIYLGEQNTLQVSSSVIHTSESYSVLSGANITLKSSEKITLNSGHHPFDGGLEVWGASNMRLSGSEIASAALYAGSSSNITASISQLAYGVSGDSQVSMEATSGLTDFGNSRVVIGATSVNPNNKSSTILLQSIQALTSSMQTTISGARSEYLVQIGGYGSDFTHSRLETSGSHAEITLTASSNEAAVLKISSDVATGTTIENSSSKVSFNINPTQMGLDTYLHISGGIGQKDTNGGNIAAFGGDVMVSGNLHSPYGTTPFIPSVLIATTTMSLGYVNYYNAASASFALAFPPSPQNNWEVTSKEIGGNASGIDFDPNGVNAEGNGFVTTSLITISESYAVRRWKYSSVLNRWVKLSS